MEEKTEITENRMTILCPSADNSGTALTIPEPEQEADEYDTYCPWE